MPVWVTGQRFPTIDHVIPLASGGTNRKGNLTLSCLDCNVMRGGSTEGPPPEVGTSSDLVE